MNTISYIGNGAYCWPNSTSMLLSSIGESIAPSLIEVLGCVGIGAYALPHSNIIFFSNYSGFPDRGISIALDILGFSFIEKFQELSDPVPIEELTSVLSESPAVLGPLDMGYLLYDPKNVNHSGVDHFVLAYKIDKEFVYLHDPAGFPNVRLLIGDLINAWKAKKIGHKRGYYRYWTKPNRISTPSECEIYKKAISAFFDTYQTGIKYAKKKDRIIDSQAILFLADNAQKQVFTESEISMLTGFVFPLGARRFLDYAQFFQKHNQKLANIKFEESELLGLCQNLTVNKKWDKLSDLLKIMAQTELEFYCLLEKNNNT
jgi:hypothetical protein